MFFKEIAVLCEFTSNWWILSFLTKYPVPQVLSFQRQFSKSKFFLFIFLDKWTTFTKSCFANLKSIGTLYSKIMSNLCWPHLMSIHKLQQFPCSPFILFDGTNQILNPKVRNSMTQLTKISGISKIAFTFFPAQTTSNYSQMYLTKTTNKWGPRLSNYLPCVWVWLPQLSGRLGLVVEFSRRIQN